MACCEGSAKWGVAGIKTGFGTIGKIKEKGSPKGSIAITIGCNAISIMLSSGPDPNKSDSMDVVVIFPLGRGMVE